MSGNPMDVRAATEAETGPLSRVWYDGWHDAHAQIVPAELTSLRTLESFAERLHAALSDVRVLGPFGAPTGFCIVKNDELYQLYVSTQSRGLATPPCARSAAKSVNRIRRGTGDRRHKTPAVRCDR